MRVCIHRGAHEIGGTCIEIEAQGKRIVVEVGLPLDVDYDMADLPKVRGFKEKADDLIGILISHPHQDHYGLIRKVKADVPVLIGPAAQRIIETASLFTLKERFKFGRTVHLADRGTIDLSPFRITPYLMDHSAYDAYMLLIEADGRKLLYTGDVRGHGRKARLFERFLRDPPKDIDVLLMEGTCVGRTDGEAQTEDDLVPLMADMFKRTKGMALVCCSGQNIDRLVTIMKACNKAGRSLIVDGYTANMILASGNEAVTRALRARCRVFWQLQHRIRIKRNRWFHLVDDLECDRVHAHGPGDLLCYEAPRSVMLFRPSMARELEHAGCLKGAGLVYSMWKGYLDRPDGQKLQHWLDEHDIPLTQIHTSGHASVHDLQRLAKALDPKVLVPIHSAHPESFGYLFDRVESKKDGEWWEVGSR